MDNGSGVRLLIGVIVTAVVLALAWIALATVWMWRYQERVVFQPPPDAPHAPAPARRVEYAAADGQRLFGFVVEPANGDGDRPPAVVIAFHGNADLAAWQMPWAQELAERAGVTVFVPEYRGYGGIPGEPTYATAAADALAALRLARSLASTDVVLYGHSLGTALATELAEQMTDRPPRALVLVSPFTSARDMAARMLVPPIPGVWQRIARVHYDTRSLVGRLDAPVHVAHGSQDLTIPVRMGRQVHAAARRPGQLLIVDGAGHNDVAETGGDRYWRWLVDAVANPSASRSPRPASRPR